MKKRSLLPLIFFASGFFGLMFEVVWMRRLTILFGTTVYAAATVLAVYMGGLSLGSLLFSKKSERCRRPLTLLSRVFIGTAISGTLVLPLLRLIEPLYHGLLREFGWNSPAIFCTRILLTAFLLLIPCGLQGMSFPLMGRIYTQPGKETGRTAGRIYAVNTLGAATGALSAGFIALPGWGLCSTSLAAGIGYLIVGTVVLSLRRAPGGNRTGKTSGAPRPAKITPSAQPPAWISEPPLRRLITMAALASGFTALSYEVLWTRVLQVFLRNSPYTFAIILASFLVGIALGSWLASRTSATLGRSLKLLAVAQLLTALSAIILQPMFGWIPVILRPLATLAHLPLMMMLLPGLVAAFTVVLLPATFMGFSFPLLCRIHATSHDGQTARGMGSIYGFNTAGSILGSLSAGFLLIPLVGTSGGNLSIALVNLATGAVVLWFLQRHSETPSARKRKKPAGRGPTRVGIRTPVMWVSLGILLAADIFMLMADVGSPARAILPPSVHRTEGRDDRVLFYRETAPGTVVVVEDQGSGLRSCFVNNNVVCGTSYDALKVIRLLGHLPMMIRGSDAPCRALVVGFGTGVTSASILKYPWVERLDCVEICPAVLEAAPYFASVNHRSFEDPRLHLVEGDGRNYVDSTENRYDIISCDPTHPALGCGSLYSIEYFTHCRQLLTPGGVACQYLPLHKMSETNFRTALATFQHIFPRVTVWMGFSHAIMVGRIPSEEFAVTVDPPPIDVGFIARVMTLPGVSEELYPCHLETPYDLLATFLMGEQGVANLLGASPPLNTDNTPILEYSGPAALDPDVWSRNMEFILRHMDSPAPLLTGPGPGGPSRTIFLSSMDIYLQGKRHLYLGQIAWRRGRLDDALNHFLDGWRINNEDLELYDMAELARDALRLKTKIPATGLNDGSQRYGQWPSSGSQGTR